MKIYKRTFEEAEAIEREARNTASYKSYGVKGPWTAIQSADANAGDTCREQGIIADSANYKQEWAAFFWTTLESIMTYSETSAETRRWFEQRGIRG